MSYVDNYILCTFCGEEEEPYVEALNESLLDGAYVTLHFTKVDQHVMGRKAIEADIYIAAGFNPDVEALVKETPWVDPDRVSLFKQGQDDDFFSEVELGLR